MWNLAPLLPGGPNGEARSTRVYRGRGELIDHIVASHRLVNPDNLPQAHTALTADPLPSVDDRPTDRRNEPGSDHAAVVATFTL